jgi:hypothetical protein
MCSFFRFVSAHYNDVKSYLLMDPLLSAVFVALTPDSDFLQRCRQMPPFLIASWLAHTLKTETVDKKAVYLHVPQYRI